MLLRVTHEPNGALMEWPSTADSLPLIHKAFLWNYLLPRVCPSSLKVICKPMEAIFHHFDIIIFLVMANSVLFIIYLKQFMTKLLAKYYHVLQMIRIYANL